MDPKIPPKNFFIRKIGHFRHKIAPKNLLRTFWGVSKIFLSKSPQKSRIFDQISKKPKCGRVLGILRFSPKKSKIWRKWPLYAQIKKKSQKSWVRHGDFFNFFEKISAHFSEPQNRSISPTEAPFEWILGAFKSWGETA